MAVLIPALSACVSRMTPGERRLAERLQQKLDEDYLLWYDVPIGPRQAHPDFVVLHPRRGLLVLEVKDWRLETIQQATRGDWTLAVDGERKQVANPAEQARKHALEVVDALKRDPQLIHHDGRWQGMLTFPWSHGVVLTRITRRQFEASGLDLALEEQRVVCSDEMLESVEPEALQTRLWDMFPRLMRGALSLPQIDRVRWNLFPQVRVGQQASLFDDQDAAAEVPAIMQVMDLQQEQLARSLGDGHRVIHGVAGSGKTMILGYRAEYLAKATGPRAKPVLVLCYNEPLAVRLQATFAARGLDDRVQARHFHKWCRDQLVAFGQPLPASTLGVAQKMAQIVQNVIVGVERGMIPSGQYRAILVDEGHDFAPDWLRLIVQMVDPASNSLLLLYDDAQSIYERRERGKAFSFRSLGVQAQGRTTILKINYRNTRQILQAASAAAAGLLQARHQEDDGIPRVQPVSCGRDGPPPVVIDLPTLQGRVERVVELVAAARNEGHAWGEIAILCRSGAVMDACAHVLRRRRLPHQLRRTTGQFDPLADSIKVMTMHASKGLEFPVVAVVGACRSSTLGHHDAGPDMSEETRLFYVAATRATERLIVANAV